MVGNSQEWEATLRRWYGDEVVRAAHDCLHCLARGSMLFQWHAEMARPRLVCDCEAFDHFSLWRIGREPLVFVTQPYGIRHEDMRKLLNFCDTNGLELEIDERAAYHLPGSVVGITLWNRAVRQKYRRDGEVS